MAVAEGKIPRVYTKCAYCAKRFENCLVKSVATHLRSQHKICIAGDSQVIRCGSCTFSTVTKRLFTDHLRQAHRFEASDILYKPDGDSGTGQDSADAHVNPRKARGSKTPDDMLKSDSYQLDLGTARVSDDSYAPKAFSSILDHTTLHDTPMEEAQFDWHRKLEMAQFVLNMYSKGNTTRKQVQHVVDNASDLIFQLSESALETFNMCKSLLPEDTSPALQAAFAKHHAVLNRNLHPLQDLNSEHKRMKLMSELGMVSAVEYVIGLWPDTYKGEQVMKRATVQYIPILKTISMLLSKKEVFDYVSTVPAAGSSIYLRDFCDGELYKSNSLFKEHPDALQISLYNDDIELGNVLGSRAGVNKLSMFYFIIKNIPNASNLQHIHLLVVAHSSDVKQFGLHKILEPLMRDLECLENGVVLDLGHTTKQIFGTIVQLPADNLAANDTAGLVTSFTARHYCRFCRLDAVACRTACLQYSNILRTQESHAADVIAGPAYTTETGVKKASPLDRLRYFSVIESMTPDIMHDILEGVGKLELSLVLTDVVCRRKLITLGRLNDIIALYDYRTLDAKNKPSAILFDAGKIKIKQTASQTWCLLRLLPIMIGEFIPEELPEWSVLLALRDCMDLLFMEKLTKDLTISVESSVKHHHSLFLEVFHDEHLIPKHHFMLHYGEAIRRNGPLVTYWCMRFEAKHRFAKLVGTVSCNFKNMPLTVARRYQLQSFSHWYRQLNTVHAPTLGTQNMVTYRGTPYKVKMVICSKMADGIPLFSEIDEVNIKDQFVTFKYRNVSTIWVPHKHAFEIECKSSELTECTLANIPYPYPLDVYSKKYICPKSLICEL